jgi:hypothetical protein
MQLTLWGDQLPKRRRKKVIPLNKPQPYSITGNDCELLGHTLTYWSLAGTTTCIDCGVHIYCPACIAAHPKDEKAIAMLCERHEQREQVSA